MICFLPWAAKSKQCKNLIVTNTFINARAHPGDFYLQTKIPEFIDTVLVTIVKRGKNPQWTLWKRLMHGCKSSWQLRFLSEVLFNVCIAKGMQGKEANFLTNFWSTLNLAKKKEVIETQILCSWESKTFPFYKARIHARKQKQKYFLGIWAIGRLYGYDSWVWSNYSGHFSWVTGWDKTFLFWVSKVTGYFSHDLHAPGNVFWRKSPPFLL